GAWRERRERVQAGEAHGDVAVVPPGGVRGGRTCGGDRRLRKTDAHDLRLVVGHLHRELRVRVHDVVGVLRVVEQIGVKQDVIDRLRVAVEVIRVLLGYRKRVHERMQNATLDDGERVRELEVVQVAENDDLS